MHRADTSHIECDPEIAGNRPRITGTRIRVQDIVVWTELGRSPDEIVSGYPHLTLSDVHAALAYYYDHRDLIDGQIRNDDEFAAQCRAAYGARSAGRDADADPVSP